MEHPEHFGRIYYVLTMSVDQRRKRMDAPAS